MNISNKKIYIHDLIAKQVYAYDKNNNSHNHHAEFIQIMEDDNLLMMDCSDYIYINNSLLNKKPNHEQLS